MVNTPYSDKAVNIAFANGFAGKVGLHINLTDGEPLTDPIKKNSLFCNGEGMFCGAFHKKALNRIYLNSETIADIRCEIDAQLKKYKEYGITLFHIDSHLHVHNDFPVWLAIKPLIKKYGIKSVRLSRNLYKNTSLQNKVYKFFYNNEIKRANVFTTDYFVAMHDFFDCRGDIKNNSIVEIMLHPVYVNDKLVDECEDLKSQVMLCFSGNDEIISYGDV